ncbi:hypothetical protein [Prescottella equi]
MSIFAAWTRATQRRDREQFQKQKAKADRAAIAELRDQSEELLARAQVAMEANDFEEAERLAREGIIAHEAKVQFEVDNILRS